MRNLGESSKREESDEVPGMQVQIHCLIWYLVCFFGYRPPQAWPFPSPVPSLCHTLPIHTNSFFIQEKLRDETLGLLNVWVPTSCSPHPPPSQLSWWTHKDFMHQIPSGSSCHFRIHTVLMNANTVFLLDRAWQDQQSQIREKLLAFQQRLINSDSIKSILINYAERYYCCL